VPDIDQSILRWLLDGDVAIQYQTTRDLLGEDRADLRARIAHEGWGARFLSCRRSDGHWGRAYYQPKWTSTHYTLVDLRNLDVHPQTEEVRDSVALALRGEKGSDGGINPSVTIEQSDVCVNGMFLNVASYFQADQGALESLVDFVLSQQLADGGFNCEYNRRGAVHSSLHSTLSVAEGIAEYVRNGYGYRARELSRAEEGSREFILRHRLFRSDRSGEVIDSKMLMLSYPSRWHYDILRALDYFRAAGIPYDPRMEDALAVLSRKRRADGSWPLQARHPGQFHFEMELPGQPSRWNTLRALRVSAHFGV
jgi:hypothetical protein